MRPVAVHERPINVQENRVVTHRLRCVLSHVKAFPNSPHQRRDVRTTPRHSRSRHRWRCCRTHTNFVGAEIALSGCGERRNIALVIFRPILARRSMQPKISEARPAGGNTCIRRGWRIGDHSRDAVSIEQRPRGR